jgi:hypothetical protein
MGLNRVLTFISLPLLAIPAVAAADDASSPAPAAGAVFPSMGADGSANQLGAQIQLMSIDGADESIKRFDLNGQYVTPSGMGGYVTFGGSSVDGESSVGGLEAGAIYRRPSAGTSQLAARAGIILPTGSSGSNEFPVHLISTVYSRPSDYLTGLPETTSLRVAVSPSVHQGDLVARADIGLDLPIAGEMTDEIDGPFLHVDLGAGFHNGKGGVLAELSTMSYLEETDELIHLIAITAEMTAGKVTPYATLSRPFVSGNDGGEFDITNVAIGLRGRI